MTTQIAVRIPDELVKYVDGLVRAGAGSRASVVSQALLLHRGQALAERDAQILEEVGDYDDFDELTRHASIDG